MARRNPLDEDFEGNPDQVFPVFLLCSRSAAAPTRVESGLLGILPWRRAPTGMGS